MAIMQSIIMLFENQLQLRLWWLERKIVRRILLICLPRFWQLNGGMICVVSFFVKRALSIIFPGIGIPPYSFLRRKSKRKMRRNKPIDTLLPPLWTAADEGQELSTVSLFHSNYWHVCYGRHASSCSTRIDEHEDTFHLLKEGKKMHNNSPENWDKCDSRWTHVLFWTAETNVILCMLSKRWSTSGRSSEFGCLIEFWFIQHKTTHDDAQRGVCACFWNSTKKPSRRQPFQHCIPLWWSVKWLEETSMTRRRCGERRPSGSSCWNANFQHAKRPKTDFWGIPKRYGLRPLNR